MRLRVRYPAIDWSWVIDGVALGLFWLACVACWVMS